MSISSAFQVDADTPSTIEVCGLLKFSSKHLLALAEYMRSQVSSTLTCLELINCGLSASRTTGMDALISALAGCKSIVSLNFSRNDLFGDSGSLLATSIGTLFPALVSLHLDETSFTVTALAELAAAVAARAPIPLTSLSLFGNHLGLGNSSSCVDSLRVMITQATQLTHLNLSHNALGTNLPSGVPPLWLNDLVQHSNLTSLHLACNEFTDAAYLAWPLRSPKMTRLDISQNKIGMKGLVEISAALAGNPSCTALNLSSCELFSVFRPNGTTFRNSNDGVKALTRALARGFGSSWRELTLDCRDWSDETLVMLFDAVRLFPTLEILSIKTAKLGARGFDALLEYIRVCQLLRRFFFHLRHTRMCNSGESIRFSLFVRRSHPLWSIYDPQPVLSLILTEAVFGCKKLCVSTIRCRSFTVIGVTCSRKIQISLMKLLDIQLGHCFCKVRTMSALFRVAGLRDFDMECVLRSHGVLDRR